MKKQMYDAELNKGIALPLSEMSPTKGTEEEIFPKVKHKIKWKALGRQSHNDIFTPPDNINKRFKMQQMHEEKNANKFFITENENIVIEIK